MTDQFYWHVHHDVLCEPLVEPFAERIDYIKLHKPKEEVETRLRLMKPVRGELPKAYVEAWKAYVEARKAYDEAWKARDEARKAYSEAWKARDEARKAYEEAGKAYDEAWKAYSEAWKAKDLLALHKAECPNCPWNGETIFP